MLTTMYKNILLTVIVIVIFYLVIQFFPYNFHSFNLSEKAIAQDLDPNNPPEIFLPKSFGKLIQIIAESRGSAVSEDSELIFQADDGTIRIVTGKYLKGETKNVYTIKRK